MSQEKITYIFTFIVSLHVDIFVRLKLRQQSVVLIKGNLQLSNQVKLWGKSYSMCSCKNKLLTCASMYI